jgi:glutamate racemase
MENVKKNPVGIFDSGLGGLTVVREVQKMLPHEDIVYLGDSARLPYGTKSKRQIIEFSIANAKFLLSKNVKALVVACNTSSANAFYILSRKLTIPVMDVICPASSDAVQLTETGRVGVIGTRATIASGAYEREIKKLNPRVHVFSAACPLFVSLVEEGWINDPITKDVIERYLEPLKKKKIDTLILGCTHYPLLKKAIAQNVKNSIKIIDSGPSAADVLISELKSRNIENTKKSKGILKIFVTDLSPQFTKIGERFLQQPLNNIRIVNL